MRPNVLLITADQWRGDCLGVMNHPVVRTPNLDRFAQKATVFEKHFATCAPCSPARASLYTGLYQMNHRVVQNGTPLDNRFDNVARAARRAGYVPTLFGYTDTSPDPRVHHSNDPSLSTYEGTLPGFEVRQYLAEDDKPWLAWLADRGYSKDAIANIHAVVPDDKHRISLNPTAYRAEDSQTAFLTNAFLSWLREQEKVVPWFAHISFLRPHPPLSLPAPYNAMYAPEDGPEFLGAASAAEQAGLHPLIAALQEVQRLSSHIPGGDGLVRDLTRDDLRRIRALYYGSISEVDVQLGRLFAGLEAAGFSEDTLIIFTSDHAEMLGDHWMLGKGGFFEQSYHIPLMIKAPAQAKGDRVSAFTSAADVFPTLVDMLEIEPLHAPDGTTLRPFLQGGTPLHWRNAAVFEFDFRALETVLRPHLADQLEPRDLALMSLRNTEWQYVHFPALPPLLLKPVEGSGINHAVLPEGQHALMECQSQLLSLRMRHNENTLARKLVWEF